MPLGITNTTNISLTDITGLANVSSLPDFMIKINYTIYDGYLFFILLFVLFLIIFLGAQQTENQPLNNLLISSAIITVISLLWRAIIMYNNGVWIGLITDNKMWVFPIITLFLATVLWLTKKD